MASRDTPTGPPSGRHAPRTSSATGTPGTAIIGGVAGPAFSSQKPPPNSPRDTGTVVSWTSSGSGVSAAVATASAVAGTVPASTPRTSGHHRAGGAAPPATAVSPVSRPHWTRPSVAYGASGPAKTPGPDSAVVRSRFSANSWRRATRAVVAPAYVVKVSSVSACTAAVSPPSPLPESRASSSPTPAGTGDRTALTRLSGLRTSTRNPVGGDRGRR